MTKGPSTRRRPGDTTLGPADDAARRDELRRERLLVSSIGFGIAFAAARAVTHALRRQKRSRRIPFKLPGRRKRHHHLVWGILLLLGTGYAWLWQLGTGHPRSDRWGSRVTSLLYGVGSAVTLDEFALWLNLEDDYWSGEGRQSVDAVVVFGALLSMGLWGNPAGRRVTKLLQSRVGSG